MAPPRSTDLTLGPVLRGAVLRLVLLAATLAAAGCGEGELVPEQANGDVRAAAAFEEFRLFYTGPRQGDLPLTFPGLDENDDYQPGRPIGFEYGFCEEPPGEGGCPAPLQIQNFAAARENLARYTDRPPARTLCLRGVRAGIFLGDSQFDMLVLTTGRTTGKVISGGDEQTALRAVDALRSVDGKVDARGDLPAPAARLRDRTGAPCRRA